MKEIIRYFDCFAGIGGFHCGAQEIKSDRYEFSHVAFCEIEKNKAKSTEKIDGAIACIMALDRAIRCGNDTGASVYDDRGILFI